MGGFKAFATLILLISFILAERKAAATSGHSRSNSTPKWQKDWHSLQKSVEEIGANVKEINAKLGGHNATISEELRKVDNSPAIIISKLDAIMDTAVANGKMVETIAHRPQVPAAAATPEQKPENVQAKSSAVSTGSRTGLMFPKATRRIPWFSAIYAQPLSETRFFFSCGGALVHPSFVLLARNCLNDSLSADNYRIFLGPRFGNFDQNSKVRTPLQVIESF